MGKTVIFLHVESKMKILLFKLVFSIFQIISDLVLTFRITNYSSSWSHLKFYKKRRDRGKLVFNLLAVYCVCVLSKGTTVYVYVLLYMSCHAKLSRNCLLYRIYSVISFYLLHNIFCHVLLYLTSTSC